MDEGSSYSTSICNCCMALYQYVHHHSAVHRSATDVNWMHMWDVKLCLLTVISDHCLMVIDSMAKVTQLTEISFS